MDTKNWWQNNFQKSDGTFDITRFAKYLSVVLFAVYVVFFISIMIKDGICYFVGWPVDFNESIVVVAKVGGVVVASMMLPTLDYRSHKKNGHGIVDNIKEVTGMGQENNKDESS